jgi:UDP-N-acetylglucosamine/UDP-N-acetylgalactosamine diphosphorylase
MALTYREAHDLLRRHGQEHVLQFWPRLTPLQQDGLLAQVEAIDFEAVIRMRALLGHGGDAASPAAGIAPAPVVAASPAQQASGQAAGEAALRAGEVAALLVAGGQGTRLGFEGPKGMYPVGPVSGASLFEFHARKILALEQRHGGAVPFYVMTSPANDAPTRAFFEANRYFGLHADRVMFFRQGELPALWPDGRIVLEQPDRVFMGPDGHGGVLAALERTGMRADMERRGVRTVFYFQVDNPLVEIADPVFIGLHRTTGAEMSLKVCAKRGPDEGLGVVVTRGGRLSVVEYTELTDAQKRATEPDGELRFKFGSVAIHVFSLDFLKRETSAGLPLHRAHKKVAYCDDDGRPAKPAQPNAFKFEKFIFDALPDARQALVLAFAREDEFSPVKNASGADSRETAQRDLILKAARRAEALGAAIARSADGTPAHRIEIDPACEADPAALARRLGPGFRLDRDTYLKEESR